MNLTNKNILVTGGSLGIGKETAKILVEKGANVIITGRDNKRLLTAQKYTGAHPIVFDISENLDEFISKDAPTRAIVFDYYMNFVPYFANLFSPLFTFIAVIYFTSKMAYNTEIIAILSSGVSYRRLMRPYLVSALILATFSFILGNFIIPPANRTMNDFREEYIDNRKAIAERNIHRQIEPGLYIYMSNFNNNDVGSRFTMERFEGAKLVEKLTADNIRYDKETGKWIINNYWKRTIFDDYELLENGFRIDTTLNIKPEDFKLEKNEFNPEFLSK